MVSSGKRGETIVGTERAKVEARGDFIKKVSIKQKPKCPKYTLARE